ncbi:hypothetical protein [Caldisericum sp.]|uniref:hypothetical protein n=1 Tax=Caldisericum sp. TaxID=2499687 RepID=UPI003D13F378
MNRKSIGIALVLSGSPIIYFFRDGLGLSPEYFFFTGTFMFLFLLFLLSKDIMLNLKIQKPNMVLFYLTCFYWLIVTNYFLLSDYPDKNKDIFYFLYLLTYFLLLLFVRDEEVKFIYISFLLSTFLSNFIFIYFFKTLFTSITFREIGSRAYIGQEKGNPNLYANIAYYGIIASLFTLKKAYKQMYKILAFINIPLSLLVILLTQNRTVLIVLLIVVICFIVKEILHILTSFKVKKIDLFKIIKIFAIFIFFFLLIFVIIPQDILSIYFSNYSIYLEGLLLNLSGKVGDQSSIQRIDAFNMIINELKTVPENYLLGMGYKYEWLDIPFLQAFRDLGFLGGFVFLIFHAIVVSYVIRYLFLKRNIDLNFISLLLLLYILIFFNCMAHGQPYDLSHWLLLITIVRFLKLPKNGKVN